MKKIAMTSLTIGILCAGAAFSILAAAPRAAAPATEIRAPMSDRDLLRKFNLDHPGLERVKAALDAGDLEAARAELAKYYRARGGRFHPFDPEEPVSPGTSARRLRLGAQPLLDRTAPYDSGLWLDNGLFDWEAAEIRFKERTYFFESFGRASLLDETDEVARSLIVLVRSFIDQFHAPAERGQNMWFSMNTGIRMRSGWPVAFLALLHSPHFTDEDLILFLKSVWDQTNHLRHYHSETSNWLTFEMAGLYTSGTVYPEFKDAEEWRQIASQTAVEDIRRGWLPDGMTIELSPAYGRYFSNYFFIYDLAELTGRLDEFNLRELVARTEIPFESYLKIMGPDRFAPATNNNRPADVREILESALARFPDRDDFRWVVSDGEEGSPPAYRSVLLPYAGVAAMRAGWGPEDSMLYFDFGPVGYRHAHQDGLNVMLWAYGRQVLFDPGLVGYEYDDPFVNYAIDSFSHNTVSVDRRPQRRIWYENPHPNRMPYQKLEPVRWQTTERFDFAAGVYDEAYGLPGASDAYPYSEGSNFTEGWVYPATHYRSVYFYKPDLFLVADTLVAKDGQAHDYDLRWHLDSTVTATGADGMRIATADVGIPNLELVPLLTEGLEIRATTGQTEPEILGWRVARSDSPEPATTVQHLKSGPGTVRYLTLLLPLEAGTSSRLRSHAQLDGSSAAFELEDGRRFTVRLPADFWEKPEVSIAEETETK